MMDKAEKNTTDATDEVLDFDKFKDVDKTLAEMYNLLSHCCTGEALTMVKSVTTFEGFLAWQKIFKKYNPMTMARAIRLMTEVASPKERKIRDDDDAITSWENEVKRLDAEYNEKWSETLKVAVVTSMPPVMQDFIYTSVDDSSKHSMMVPNVRSWVSKKDGYDVGASPDGCWRGVLFELDAGSAFRRGVGRRRGSCSGAEHSVPSMGRVGGGICPGLRHQPSEGQGEGQGHRRELPRRLPPQGQEQGATARASAKGSDSKGKGFQGPCLTCGIVGHKGPRVQESGARPVRSATGQQDRRGHLGDWD